tara:strand:- start:6789 stop:7679 length:891 start_codon:yes stop_codon:yes gene_type:complete
MDTTQSTTQPVFHLRNAIVSIGLGILFVTFMTAWTWKVNGSLAASRTLTDFLMPLGVVWMTLFVLAIWLWLRRSRLESLIVAVLWVMIAITFNGTMAGKITSSVEVPRSATLSDGSPPLRAVLVLGGSVFKAYDGVIEVSPEGQRVVLAAQYWHAGRTQAIVCSGGQSVTENEPHSKNVRSMLESLNVPAEVIHEVGGTNTTGEMEHLLEFFESTPSNFPSEGRVGLVTSAFHMTRSMRLAKTIGLDQAIDLIPLPCCYRRGASYGFTPRKYIPRANSGDAFAIALKEKLAAIIGR